MEDRAQKQTHLPLEGGTGQKHLYRPAEWEVSRHGAEREDDGVPTTHEGFPSTVGIFQKTEFQDLFSLLASEHMEMEIKLWNPAFFKTTITPLLLVRANMQDVG